MVAHPRTQPKTMYLYDMMHLLPLDLKDETNRKRIWDEAHFVSSLQGIVNQSGPKLYILYVKESDTFWYNELRKPGRWLSDWEVKTIPDLDSLIRTFRRSIRGLVVYDPHVAATSNVASTIAGAEKRACVRYDPSEGSLYRRLTGVHKIPVKRWLLHPDGSSLFTGKGTIPGSDEPSTGSAKLDAYVWAIKNYLETGRCSPRRMGYYLDQYWMKNPFPSAQWNHTLTNHDFFISHRGFFFDLSPWDDETPIDDPNQPLGAEIKVLKRILLAACRSAKGEFIHIGGFVPWAYKYTDFPGAGGKHEGVPSEWKFSEIISAYNAYLDADALGLSAMANASFYRHFPLKARYPQRRPTEADLKEAGLLREDGKVVPKHYVTFYVGDYDSAAWVYNMMPALWADPNRGKVPLTWAINPNLADRAAPMLDWLRAHASPDDTFMAGDSGAGYINPGMLEEPRGYSGLPSGLEAWKEHCAPYYQRWDLGITGFIIDGNAPPMTPKALDCYASFSPEGLVAQKIPEHGLHGEMPFIRMSWDLDGSPADAARTIHRFYADGSTQFRIFRAILKSPTWYKEVADDLKKIDPQVEVVDACSFFALLKKYLKSDR